MVEDIKNYLFLDVDDGNKFSLIKETIVNYCIRESHVFQCYRILKYLEIELMDLFENNEFQKVSPSIVKKILKILKTELEIVEIKMRIAHSLDDIGETSREGEVPKMKWTDAKTDLVELIYGIRNSIDGGKVTLKKIVTCFEYMFQIKIGNVYDIINEISLRKQDRVRYINRLAENLKNVLENMDA